MSRRGWPGVKEVRTSKKRLVEERFDLYGKIDPSECERICEEWDEETDIE